MFLLCQLHQDRIFNLSTLDSIKLHIEFSSNLLATLLSMQIISCCRRKRKTTTVKAETKIWIFSSVWLKSSWIKANNFVSMNSCLIDKCWDFYSWRSQDCNQGLFVNKWTVKTLLDITTSCVCDLKLGRRYFSYVTDLRA